MWTQGKRFGTIGCRRGGRVYEITTHRAEAYRPDSRKPEVAFGDDIEADLSRRDFTVNAMALRLPELTLVDPFDGLGDLAAGRLRTPLDPEVSFGDDPLRMLRAARFIAGYGLQPDPALVDAVRTGHDRLAIVSAERIRDELDKLIVVLPGPPTALWFVVDTGLAEEFLPELPGAGPRAGPDPPAQGRAGPHPGRGRQDARPDRLLRLAALFHDVGKPRTRGFGPSGVTLPPPRGGRGPDDPRAHGGAALLRATTSRRSCRLVELHLRFHTYRLGWTDKAVRRYVRDAGAAARPAERADPLRLHHPQRGQGPGARPAGWTSSSAASPSCASGRSSTPSGPTSTARR